MATLNEENTRVRALRDRLEQTILKTIPGTVRNGAKEPRLPNTSNIAFDGVEAEGDSDAAGPGWAFALRAARPAPRARWTHPTC